MTRRKSWIYEVAAPRPKLTLREMPDKGGGVYAFWWNPGRGKKGILDKISTGMVVRGVDGRLDADLIKLAEARAHTYHMELCRGTDPRQLREKEKRQQAETIAPEKRTIGMGFKMYFHPTNGAYGTNTRDVRALKRYRGHIEDILGLNLPWATLDASAGIALSRQLADRYPKDTGFRSAVRTVDLLFRAADWLRAMKLIPPDACIRPRDWSSAIKKEWRQKGKKVGPSQPRYSRSELKILLSKAGEADPRLRLALFIGPELRAVNVRLVMRSHVRLDHVGGWGLGRIKVPGSDEKPGAVIDIDPALGERLAEDMATGHLSTFEDCYQRGEISDYPLLPGRGLQPLGATGFRKLFDAYETACGVEHQRRRGWHGLRRSMSDALNEETQDENVRDAAGGWRQGSGTRQSVYNDGQDPHLIARTRHAVLAARNAVLGTDSEIESLRQEVVQLAWSGDRQSLTEARDALRRPKLTPQLTPEGVEESA